MAFLCLIAKNGVSNNDELKLYAGILKPFIALEKVSMLATKFLDFGVQSQGKLSH